MTRLLYVPLFSAIFILIAIAGCDTGPSTWTHQSQLMAAGRAPIGVTPSDRLLTAHTASAAHNQSTGCHGVQGTITADILPGGAVGTIDGDLQGPISTTLGPDPVGDTDEFVTGRAIHLIGEQTVDVTGGSLDELIGRTIIWTIQSRAIDQPPIRRVSNTLRVIEGAESGHLISHGIIDLTTLTTQFDYQGVICP